MNLNYRNKGGNQGCQLGNFETRNSGIFEIYKFFVGIFGIHAALTFMPNKITAINCNLVKTT